MGNFMIYLPDPVSMWPPESRDDCPYDLLPRYHPVKKLPTAKKNHLHWILSSCLHTSHLPLAVREMLSPFLPAGTVSFLVKEVNSWDSVPNSFHIQDCIFSGFL
jgi:hypothetical protein